MSPQTKEEDRVNKLAIAQLYSKYDVRPIVFWRIVHFEKLLVIVIGDW